MNWKKSQSSNCTQQTLSPNQNRRNRKLLKRLIGTPKAKVVLAAAALSPKRSTNDLKRNSASTQGSSPSNLVAKGEGELGLGDYAMTNYSRCAHFERVCKKYL